MATTMVACVMALALTGAGRDMDTDATIRIAVADTGPVDSKKPL